MTASNFKCTWFVNMLKHAKTSAQSFKDISLFLLLPRYISHRERALRLDAEREGMHPQHFYWLCVCACVRLCECIGTFGFPDDSACVHFNLHSVVTIWCWWIMNGRESLSQNNAYSNCRQGLYIVHSRQTWFTGRAVIKGTQVYSLSDGKIRHGSLENTLLQRGET